MQKGAALAFMLSSFCNNLLKISSRAVPSTEPAFFESLALMLLPQQMLQSRLFSMKLPGAAIEGPKLP